MVRAKGITFGVLAALIAVTAAISAPAFADGGPALPRGALARGEVKAPPPPPPKKAPAPAPAAPKAVTPPVTPPVTPAAPPAPAAPVPAAPVPPPAKVEPTPPPPAAPTAPDGARAGVITLDEGVTLTIPQGWAFWAPAEAQAYLRRTQAAAPAGRVLGMIAPAEMRPSDANFWGSVVSFNPVGRVAEERGERFTQPDFLDETRATRPATAPRLTGFPVAPAYDPSRKGITWGERYDPSAPGAADRPIRLEHRLLGRRGVVGLTTPARSEQLMQLTALAPTLSAMLGFAPGSGYADAAAGDPAPVFDLPGVITNRPRGAAPVGMAAGAGGSGISGTPLTPTLPQPTATADAAGAAGAAATGGLLGLMDGWFQWIAAGVVVLAALPWLIFRRREDDDVDANLQPR